MKVLLLLFLSLFHGDDICIEDEGKRYTARYESLGQSFSLYDKATEEFIFTGKVKVKTKTNELGQELRILKSDIVSGYVNLATGKSFVTVEIEQPYQGFIPKFITKYELFDLSVYNNDCAK